MEIIDENTREDAPLTFCIASDGERTSYADATNRRIDLLESAVTSRRRASADDVTERCRKGGGNDVKTSHSPLSEREAREKVGGGRRRT